MLQINDHPENNYHYLRIGRRQCCLHMTHSCYSISSDFYFHFSSGQRFPYPYSLLSSLFLSDILMIRFTSEIHEVPAVDSSSHLRSCINYAFSKNSSSYFEMHLLHFIFFSLSFSSLLISSPSLSILVTNKHAATPAVHEWSPGVSDKQLITLSLPCMHSHT